MKSDIAKNGTQNNLPFPKLMLLNDGDIATTIVLMYATGSGVVVYTKDHRTHIGEHTTTWNMKIFEDFHGTLTLSND